MAATTKTAERTILAQMLTPHGFVFKHLPWEEDTDECWEINLGSVEVGSIQIVYGRQASYFANVWSKDQSAMHHGKETADFSVAVERFIALAQKLGYIA